MVEIVTVWAYMSGMAEWAGTRVTNMVRRDGRTYYAQIKIKGKTYRRSLKTHKADIARIKLPETLQEIRDGVQLRSLDLDESTLGGCLDRWEDEQDRRPDLKKSTKVFNKERARVMRSTMMMDAPVAAVSNAVLDRWWAQIGSDYNPRFANNMLSVLRDILDMQVAAGYRPANPAREIKRMKIERVVRWLPDQEQFTNILKEIRGQRRRFSEEAADWVAWLAYTGMRPGEVSPLMWEDVGSDFITVRGGEEGTKNRKERLVPVMAALQPIIERRRVAGGLVFNMKKPRGALANACDRLEIKRLRIYDMRHLFATRCIESGVDFATVAKWLGHSDGGALVARVYGHVRDSHGLEQAKRVEF